MLREVIINYLNEAPELSEVADCVYLVSCNVLLNFNLHHFDFCILNTVFT